MPVQSKWLDIDIDDPRAQAVCDYSGVICMRRDLRPQLEYAGSGLVNTGFLVHVDFLDEPNPQLLAPRVYFDPIPLFNPRPPQGGDTAQE